MARPLGETGVIVSIVAAEPVVAALRSTLDSSAGLGAPAHVTLLYPFLDLPDLTQSDVDDLASICATEPAFDVAFRRVERWPAVVWLPPEPDDPFRRLTAAIAARWPQRPPYGGAWPDPTPHLTVADVDDAQALDDAQAAVAPHLPIAARVSEAQLIAYDGERYRVHHRFSLARV